MALFKSEKTRMAARPPEDERDVRPPEEEVGRILAAAREKRGIKLEQASKALRIRHYYLEAIEKGNFDRLPGQAYTIGFLRTYASYLNLDAQRLVDRLKNGNEAPSADSQFYFPTPETESRIPGAALFFVGALIAVMAYGGWYYLSSRGANEFDLVPELPDRLAKAVGIEQNDDGQAAGAGSELPEPPQGTRTAEEPETVSEAVAPEATAPEAVEPEEALPETATLEISEPEISEPEILEPEVSEPEVSEPGISEPEVLEPEVPEPEVSETVAEEALAEEPLAQEAATETSEGLASPEEGTLGEAPSPEEVPTVEEEAVEAAETVAAQEETLPETLPETLVEEEPLVAEAAPEEVTAEASEAAPPAAETAAVDPLLAELPDEPQVEEALPSLLPEAPSESPAPETAPLPPSPVEVEEVAAGQAVGGETALAAAEIPAVPGEEGDLARLLQPEPRLYGEENQDARVVVQASQDSWVQVRAADGELLLTRVLRPGDRFLVPNQAGITMITGNAAGVEIVLDGRKLPPLGDIGQVRRDIPLDPDALLAGEASVN